MSSGLVFEESMSSTGHGRLIMTTYTYGKKRFREVTEMTYDLNKAPNFSKEAYEKRDIQEKHVHKIMERMGQYILDLEKELGYSKMF